MNIYILSLILFVVGFVEYWVDQHQKIILSRLRFFSTMFFQLLNKLFEFGVNVWVFGTIMTFWEHFRSGDHNLKLLLPYLLYTLGAVIGTGAAIALYSRNKKKRDREKALKLLEKARAKKKKLGQVKPDISSDVTVSEELFDPVEIDDIKSEAKERAIAAATDKIVSKIDKAFEDQTSKEAIEEKQEEKDAQQKDNQNPTQL